jgi:hypothetical protein
MTFPKEFYIVPEDVFRLGNADSPRLTHIRSQDVNTISINGITVVIANGKGVSLFDKEGINESPMSGWIWKIDASTQLPIGLLLVKDKPHHYCISPTQNMPVDKFKGLLEEFALRAERVLKKEGRAI